MTIHALLVINKAGGLVFNRDFTPSTVPSHLRPLAPLGANDWLVFAGTFHGVHAISARISPFTVRGPGLHTVETESLKLTCFQTPTGIKFIAITSLGHPQPMAFLGKAYEIYAETVMRNPFYASEMPIRNNESFEKRLDAQVKAVS